MREIGRELGIETVLKEGTFLSLFFIVRAYTTDIDHTMISHTWNDVFEQCLSTPLEFVVSYSGFCSLQSIRTFYI